MRQTIANITSFIKAFLIGSNQRGNLRIGTFWEGNSMRWLLDRALVEFRSRGMESSAGEASFGKQRRARKIWSVSIQYSLSRSASCAAYAKVFFESLSSGGPAFLKRGT